jgi:hypothetical protein
MQVVVGGGRESIEKRDMGVKVRQDMLIDVINRERTCLAGELLSVIRALKRGCCWIGHVEGWERR